MNFTGHENVTVKEIDYAHISEIFVGTKGVYHCNIRSLMPLITPNANPWIKPLNISNAFLKNDSSCGVNNKTVIEHANHYDIKVANNDQLPFKVFPNDRFVIITPHGCIDDSVLTTLK